MDFSPPLVPAAFLRRYKRFLADVRLPDGQEVVAHCPNSGAMTGCLPALGGRVWLRPSADPKRRCPYTLVLTETPEALVLVDTQRPNELVAEAVAGGLIPPLAGYETLKREVPYDDQRSRIDLLLKGPGRPDCLVEVKSATLPAGQGLVRFPDAVTTRGTKHLEALMRAKAAGQRAVLLFCASRTDAQAVAPADDIDPRYGQALRAAAAAGVEVLAVSCALTPEGAKVSGLLPVSLKT